MFPHISANYSPDVAANPHPLWHDICPPRPYPVQLSNLGSKLMLNASLPQQYKSSVAYDLSLLWVKLDILYAQPQTPPSHLTHCLISLPLHTVLVKSSDSLPDPIPLFFYPILPLPLSNFNCPGKVMVGPQGTKHQFIINVTEEGLQEALGSLIWEAMTESVWSSCFSQADSEGLCACMSACAIHQNNGGSLFLTQANLCLHHPGHLYHTHIWYILSLFTALECRQQVSFSSERAVCVIEEPRRVLCAVPPSRGCRGSSWNW